MRSRGSCSTLGSVALGPPDKMGSALRVLARVGQEGQRVPGWGDGSRWGWTWAASAVGTGFARPQKMLRGHSFGTTTPTPARARIHTHTHPYCDKPVLGLKTPSFPFWVPEVSKRGSWRSSPRKRGGEGARRFEVASEVSHPVLRSQTGILSLGLRTQW